MNACSNRISSWAAQETALAVLREVGARCVPAGIPVVAVKGAVTSRLLHQDAAERPITDVDVRIRPVDFWRMGRLASAAGWRPLEAIWTWRSRAYQFGPLALDVESHIGPPGVCALSVEAILSRARPFLPAPGIVVPDPYDHALLLAVNAFKDQFVRSNPAALRDLELLAIDPSFDVDAFVQRVLEARSATMAWTVASWIEGHSGSDAWTRIRLELEGRRQVRRAYGERYLRSAARQSRDVLNTPLYRNGLYLFSVLGADDLRGRGLAIGMTAAFLAERLLRRVTMGNGPG